MGSGPARRQRTRDDDTMAIVVPEGSRRSGAHLRVAPDARSALVAHRREEWAAQLVELGGPNTLLWYADLPAGTLDLTTAHLGARGHLLAGVATPLAELYREPGALEDARRRVAGIAARAQEVEEEHGVRTTFLGIGMATWTVRLPQGRHRAPAAPVLLRAVRVRPADATHEEWVLEPGDELEVNPVLVQFMASAGLDLDTAGLEELAASGSTLDPYPTYAALARVCEGVPDFSVEPKVVLSTFPYFKAPLAADLTAQAGTLASVDVVAALAGDDEVMSAVAVGADPDALADDRDVLVLDADAAQREAVAAVRAGSNLVVDGPPGTGKTQTVANLVAGLAADGRSVLLVSEKRAAVDDLVSRLARVGLDGLVLDLHSGAHDRRRVLRDLVAGLDGQVAAAAGPSAGEGPGDAAPAAVRAGAAARLDEHVAALHERRSPWGVTLHEVQESVCAFAGMPRPPRSRVRFTGEVLADLDREAVDDAVRTVTRLAAVAAWDAEGADDPWYGARLTSDDDVAEARRRVARLAEGGVAETRRILGEVFRGIHLPQRPTVLDWGRVLRTVGDVRDTLEVFRPEVFDIPLGDLVSAVGTRAQRRSDGADLGTVERARLRRQARSLLRPGRPPADLRAALAAAHEQRDAWRSLAGSGGRPEIPVELDRAQVAYAALVDDLSWLDRHLPVEETWDDEPPEGLAALDLVDLEERVAALAAAAPRLDAAPTERTALDTLGARGLAELADDLRGRGVGPEHVEAEVRWVWWCSLAEEIRRADPRVAAHDGRALTRAVAELAGAERDLLARAPGRVATAVGRYAAEARRRYPEQEQRLRSEAARARRPLALRELVTAGADVALAARPCWAMSPLDVPSLLPPGQWFDVVVVDEASRVSPAVAVAALSRGAQVVLVGDTAQLLPEPFVTGASGEVPTELAEAFAEHGSVLDALAPVLPRRPLTWHYRSLDERLVAFANTHLYGGRLVAFPATSTEPVLQHVVVEGHGVVAEGEAAVETTTAEVEQVAALVVEHARTRPGRSLMVVALGPVHAARIEASVRAEVADLHGRARAFFDADTPEPFVVLDAARAQGVERDDVLLAVGFGTTPHGRVIHRFGVLSTDEGARTLAVATTRARRTMTVVSTITADDLDPDRLRSEGARLLRELLAHAEAAGGAPVAEGHDAADDDALAEAQAAPRQVLVADLARRLRGHGLVVHEGVGSPSDPVDLAVDDPREPGTRLLAVECDGPRYAATASSRDRDRLRAEQLESRGWRHLRVWSTDLFRDPAREVSRVLEAVGVRKAPGDDD